MVNLEIELGAQIKDLQSKLDQAQKDLKAFSQKADANLGNFAKGAKGAGTAVTGMGKSTANAVPAVTEFSRVIQDAPYGMQGVANNLQQLTANFGNLSKSAGGTLPALKLMLSSLAGPAGLLFAVSAVTSAIVYFGNSSQTSAKQAEELAKKKQSLADVTKTYLETMEAVRQSRITGEQSAVRELVNLDLLKKQVQDTTLSLNDRKKALKELRKLYPDYLKDLSDEKILNGDLSTSFKTLTKDILERAKATAAMNTIIKNSERILALENQITDKKAEIEAKKAENLYKAAESLANASSYGSDVRNIKAVDVVVDVVGVGDAKKELFDLSLEFNKLKKDNENLLSNIKITPTIDIKGGGEESGTKEAINKSVQAIGLQINTALAELQITAPAIPLLTSTLTQFDIDRLTLQARLLQMNDEISNIIQNGTMQAFAGIGDAIGSAMAGAGSLANNLGKSLLSTLGSVLTQLGMMAIKIGVGIKAIKLALKSLNPAVAIAAGVGLVALGSFFSNQSSKIADTGGGGTNAGTSTGASGGGSFTGGFSGGGGNQRVVFEIAGRKLIGVIQNEIRAQGNSGVNFAF